MSHLLGIFLPRFLVMLFLREGLWVGELVREGRPQLQDPRPVQGPPPGRCLGKRVVCLHWRRLSSTQPAALDSPTGHPHCQHCIPRVPVLLRDLGKCNSLSEPQFPALESGDNPCRQLGGLRCGAAALFPAAAASKNPRGVLALPREGRTPWPGLSWTAGRRPHSRPKLAPGWPPGRTWGEGSPRQPDS